MAANTITNHTQFQGSRDVAVYFTLACNGDQETGTTIYSSSSIATAIGLPDSMQSRILAIKAVVASGATAPPPVVTLLWKATTNVLAACLSSDAPLKVDFREFGGLLNQGGAGKTGDILITTTGLLTGDAILIELIIRRD